MKKLKNQNYGFTLAELMISIGLFASLSALLILSYQQSVKLYHHSIRELDLQTQMRNTMERLIPIINNAVPTNAVPIAGPLWQINDPDMILIDPDDLAAAGGNMAMAEDAMRVILTTPNLAVNNNFRTVAYTSSAGQVVNQMAITTNARWPQAIRDNITAAGYNFDNAVREPQFLSYRLRFVRDGARYAQRWGDPGAPVIPGDILIDDNDDNTDDERTLVSGLGSMTDAVFLYEGNGIVNVQIELREDSDNLGVGANEKIMTNMTTIRLPFYTDFVGGGN